MIAGLTYNFLPFMVLPIYASLEQIDAAADRGGEGPLLDRADRLPAGDPADLDARAWSPATLLTFIPAVGDYVNASFLGGANQAMIGNVIQSQFLVTKDYPTAAALSFILMAMILVGRRRSTSASRARRR